MTGGAYYNEHDPFAAAWLRELIKAGLIADGEVDERSIEAVTADDVRGFRQCHFFAGIGGWSYALRLAGWPDDRECWTGSCPCQPFSSAGAQAGGHDPRDLWPVWVELVKKCRPVVVFGEQVEAAIGHGWLDRLCDDLEAEGYAVGACGLPAASVSAFHIRNRLWFVAESGGAERGSGRAGCSGADGGWAHAEPPGSGDVGIVADAASGSSAGVHRVLGAHERSQGEQGTESAYGRADGGLADADGWSQVDRGLQRRGQHGLRAEDRHVDGAAGFTECAENSMGDTSCAGLSQQRSERRTPSGSASANAREAPERAGPYTFWSDAVWIPCRDGKARPVEPSTFPLAYGVSARVGRLRGYGNAIVPQVAQVFIESYLDATPESAR